MEELTRTSVQSWEKTYTLSKSCQFRTTEFFMRRQDFRRLVRTAVFIPNDKIVNRALNLCHAHASAGDGKKRSYRNSANSAQVPGPDWIRLAAGKRWVHSTPLSVCTCSGIP
jgi:hypothetical protein